MSNIIDAIINIVKNPILELQVFYKAKNRANSMGDALEEYIKDLFASSINLSEVDRNIAISKTFSYLGNQNNPPDSMLRGGDAIEVKKIESPDSGLALNSSYPKAKLFANSPMITVDCKRAEVWQVKDFIYAVGVVKNSSIKSLCFVYGDDYAANADIYDRIRLTIKDGLLTSPAVEFADTKELGRVNRVDPLGITYLRIRGMWGIDNPFTVFRYVYTRNHSNKFNFMAIINEEKYNSFDNKNELEQLNALDQNLSITNIQIKNPNNPAQLKNAKLITFQVR